MRQRFKKLASICLSVSILALSSTQIFATTSTSDVAQLTPVISIPVGEGSQNVKVLTSVEGSTPQGPQSLTVAPNGTIYLLDSLQQQVMVINGGEITATIPVPNLIYPRDILFSGNHLFILGSDAVVEEITLDGSLVKEYPLPEGTGSLYIHRLAEQHGKVTLIADNYVTIPLGDQSKVDLESKAKSKDRGIENAEGQKFAGEYIDYKNGSILSMDGTVNIPIQTDQAFGSATIIDFDNNSNMFVLIEELADPSPIVATEVTVREYDKKGQMIGVAKLPHFDAYPSRPVDVTKKGDVYLLIPTSNQVTVYKADLGKKYVSDLPATRAQILADAKANAGTSILSTYLGNPYSRSVTRSRAYNMADVTWTWSTNYDYLPSGSSRPSDANKPLQLPSTNGTSVTGIPYLWGGWDTPYSHTDGAKWLSWSGALTYYGTNKGPVVGDTSSAGSVLIGGNGAGVDCSGFVASAADVYDYSGGKPGTGNIATDAMSVYDTVGSNSSMSSFSGMQPMDIFVKSGDHVLFYDYRKNDGTGINTVEATTSYGNSNAPGNTQGAKRYFRTWSDLSGYSHKTWWSKQSGNDFNNAITTLGSGSQFKGTTTYYKWTYTSSISATKTVTLTASSGDPDLYVYNSGYGLMGSNTNYGSGSYSFTATPGSTYYFAVYGYSDNGFTISVS